MQPLKDYLEKQIISFSYGDYDGIQELSLVKLVTLKALIDLALYEIHKDNG